MGGTDLNNSILTATQQKWFLCSRYQQTSSRLKISEGVVRLTRLDADELLVHFLTHVARAPERVRHNWASAHGFAYVTKYLTLSKDRESLLCTENLMHIHVSYTRKHAQSSPHLKHSFPRQSRKKTRFIVKWYFRLETISYVKCLELKWLRRWSKIAPFIRCARGVSLSAFFPSTFSREHRESVKGGEKRGVCNNKANKSMGDKHHHYHQVR